MCYDDVAIGENNYGVLFCANINTNCRNMLYCMHCRSSSNCFGCIGLHDAEYCIFNKQYTSKEKYEEEVERIIRHMIATKERGEFFHPSLSPFGYNETVAQEYYPEKASGSQPLAPSTEMEMGTKPVAGTRKLEAFGYKRSTYEAPKPVSDKVIL
jgi:hypothetical protein